MERIRVTGALCGLLLAVAGCGESRHPDSGAGAGEAVPPTINCTDLAARLGSCFEVLCNENTHSTMYTGLGDLLASQFEAQCTEDVLKAHISSTQWSCAFQ